MNRSGTAYVSEYLDAAFWTGRFNAHWEGGAEHEEGPRSVSLEEALAWARARADVVLVRPGDDGYYSAGARRADEVPVWTPPAHPFTRRRVAQLAYMDRTEDDESIEWECEMSATVQRPDAPEIPAQRFTVTARTYEEATQQAKAIGRPALMAALRTLPDFESTGWWMSCDVKPVES
jgi:hypothetical protein